MAVTIGVLCILQRAILDEARFCRAKQGLRMYRPHYQQILSSLELVQLQRKSGHIDAVQSYTLRR